jgi:hypothetical protein
LPETKNKINLTSKEPTMKKLSLFCVGVFISTLSTAQTTAVKNTAAKPKPVNTVCTVLKKIMDNRHNNFKDIYIWDFTHKISENTHGYAVPGIEHTWDVTGYDTKLKFPGANASFVSEFKLYDKRCKRYVAYWGRYKTAAEAYKKIEVLKKQLSSCLPDYLVEERVGDGGLDATLLMMARYEFTTKEQEWDDPKIFLQFQQGDHDDENSIFLLIQGNECTAITDEAPIETVKPVVTPPSSSNQSTFAKQLLELLDYSKDGFSAIRGEKTKTEKKKELSPTVDSNLDVIFKEVTAIINYYKTSYSLEGAKENSIKETFPNENRMNYSETEFKAVYNKDLSKTQGEELYNILLEQLKKDFTEGFKIEDYFVEPLPGNYSRSVKIKRNDDKTHSIELNLWFVSGLGDKTLIPDNASVEITVK